MAKLYRVAEPKPVVKPTPYEPPPPPAPPPPPPPIKPPVLPPPPKPKPSIPTPTNCGIRVYQVWADFTVMALGCDIATIYFFSYTPAQAAKQKKACLLKYANSQAYDAQELCSSIWDQRL